nr:tyrosine-type recombinase/integrase [Streptomyces sp. AcE210]
MCRPQRGPRTPPWTTARTQVRIRTRYALAASGLTGPGGEQLRYTPHDFRRIFVTDALRSGLPPHIAARICGHRRVDTTPGHAAIYL